MNHHFNKILFIAIATLFWRCDGDENSADCRDATPDPALIEIRDFEIIPSYTDLYSEALSLEDALNAFISSANGSTLESLRDQLKVTWIKWQDASSFNFGPADEYALRANINTFPVDSFTVTQKIQNNDYSLISNDIKGFPALDLLINGIQESDEDFLAYYSNSENSQSQYLSTVTLDILSRIATVKDEWEDEYGSLFATNTGFSTGSSYSLYMNAYIQDWEQIKRDRLALPLGLLTFEIPLPDKVECYYGGYSKELAEAHVLAHESKYISEGYSGIQELVQDISEFEGENGETLDESILIRFEEGKEKLALVPDPLSETILSDPDVVNEAYQALQGMVILLKTEVTSGLGISINFSDNDGD